jgi:hypothetical protein
MATTSAICTSFKLSVMQAYIAANTFKIALYTSSATLNASTTAYSATNEVTGANYSAGGITLSGGVVTADGTTIIINFNSPTFTNITVSDIRACTIYASTDSNKALAVFDLGSATSVTTSNLPLVFPTATSTLGLIRFA